ncbi:hypothetical protein DV735_g655, partial [Chaetothyriales sp. CBS 134920]
MEKKGSQNARSIDVFRTSAAELQRMLQAGTITSAELVQIYFDQIDKHNTKGSKLQAIISTAPKDQAIKRARSLDEERKTKKDVSPFHGIPVIVKDVYNTPSLGMDTTCGSLALNDRKAKGDATIVTKMLQQGMIIIGKANLSTPSGSSSGSAVAVAAGFAPVSFGTETDGSLVQPGSRAAVFALKTTPGFVDASGIQPGNPDFDALGGFTKSAEDMANLWNHLFAVKADAITLTTRELSSSSWIDLRVGFVDPELWQPADFVTEPNEPFKEQSIQEMLAAADKIQFLGGHVARNVSLISTPAGFDDIIGMKFKSGIEEYLSLFDGPGPRTIGELIEFNSLHADAELPLVSDQVNPRYHPSQGQFEKYATTEMAAEEYDRIFKEIRRQSLGSIENALTQHGIDIIMAPADSRLVSLASAAGCPVANVPLGFADFNGRAHGLAVVARPHDERNLLRVMAAWEATFPHALAPPPMMIAGSGGAI